MDTAHFFVLYMATYCTAQEITKRIKRGRGLTCGEVSFLTFVPILVAATFHGLIDVSKFPDWYREGGPHTFRDIVGTFAVWAIGCIAMLAAWMLFSAGRRLLRRRAGNAGTIQP